MTTSTEKDIQEILHAVQRLRERYDLVICPDEYRDACRRIQSGQAYFLYRERSIYSVYLVMIQDRAVPVIFNEKTGNITTALPRSALRESDRFAPAMTRLIQTAALRQAHAQSH